MTRTYIIFNDGVRVDQVSSCLVLIMKNTTFRLFNMWLTHLLNTHLFHSIHLAT